MGLRTNIMAFYRDDSGATAVEYAIIAGLVFLAIAGAIGRLATEVGEMFNFVSTNVNNSVTGG